MSDTRTAGPATQRHTQHKPIIEEPLHDTTTSRTGDVKKVMDEINVSTTPPHPEASPDRPGAVTVSRIVARNLHHPEPYTGTRIALEACRVSVVTLASEKVNSVVGIASWDVG